MTIHNKAIYSAENPFAYRTYDVPVECFVDFLPKDLKNDDVYYCDQQEKGIRCLIKVCYDTFQTFAQSSASKLGKIFGDLNNKFLKNHDVIRHGSASQSKTHFKTQYSELCWFDKNEYPEIAKTVLENSPPNREYLPIANLIYCFTDDKNDLSTFDVYAGRGAENESIKAWVSALDRNFSDKISEDDRTKMKEEMVYSFLFRNFFTDFDFTTRNFGLLYKKDGTIELSPNFDYGEFFNPIRKNKYAQDISIDLSKLPESMVQIVIDSNKKLKEQQANATPESLAHNPYSDTYNKRNLTFVCKHYPHLAYQFLNVINDMLTGSKLNDIEKLIDSYGENGVSVIRQDQCEFVKEFIKSRLYYYSKIMTGQLGEYVEKGYIGKESHYIKETNTLIKQ